VSHALTPVVYVTSSGERLPEDALDLRYLESSPEHALRGVATDSRALQTLLESAPEPVNLVVVAGYESVSGLLETDRALFLHKVARLFLVGGHVAPHLPIDPRLAERHPERFGPSDPRVTSPEALSALLTSGQAVIWLPRDLCLWRCDVLDLTDGPVLLSALPAFLLSRSPDPVLWLRLFRTIPAHVTSAEGEILTFDPKPAAPNLYAVVAIDGAALTRELIRVLRPPARSSG
jgi:hypothetical protein